MIATFGLRLLKEPLLHFLVAGAVIFAIYGLTRGEASSVADNHIVVTADEIERLAERWQKQWQRPATPDELRGLIDRHVEEEVLYREALAMGLDRDDSVVRRRLAQKLAFLSEDLVAAREPTEEQLSAYLEAHHDRYLEPPRVSFAQVYFSSERGSSALREAELVLAQLRSGSHDTDLRELGDRILLESRHLQQTPQQVAAHFGQAFADAVLALEPGAWSGPIASGYGLHLLRMDQRIPPKIPELAEIKSRLRADWFYEQRQRANREVLRLLLDRYTVEIEVHGPAAATAALPGVNERAGQ